MARLTASRSTRVTASVVGVSGLVLLAGCSAATADTAETTAAATSAATSSSSAAATATATETAAATAAASEENSSG